MKQPAKRGHGEKSSWCWRQTAELCTVAVPPLTLLSRGHAGARGASIDAIVFASWNRLGVLSTYAGARISAFDRLTFAFEIVRKAGREVIWKKAKAAGRTIREARLFNDRRRLGYSASFDRLIAATWGALSARSLCGSSFYLCL